MMNPDQIREIVLASFPELESRERRNPDGWSFWLLDSGKVRKPQRIFRVLERLSGSEIKWVGSGFTEQWEGSSDVLIEKVRQEIEHGSPKKLSAGDQIPDGVTRQNILAAIQGLNDGVEHEFAESTGYDVLFEGRPYPPKAVVGVAAKFRNGKQLGPYDFKGGLQSKCFRVLTQNGFEIVTKGDTNPFPDELDVAGRHIEGAVTQTIVNRYERDPKARKKCIDEYGPVCQVCRMNFESIYGAIGEGFIHVHHIKQLSEIGKEYEVDPVLDLVPVCPNCHAMLHKRKPPYSIDELKKLYKLDKT
jgi:5-methylcytosine-specific restriction protein A